MRHTKLIELADEIKDFIYKVNENESRGFDTFETLEDLVLDYLYFEDEIDEKEDSILNGDESERQENW